MVVLQPCSTSSTVSWITVGQGPTLLAVGAGGGCLNIFTLIYPFFPLSLSLGGGGGVVEWCDGAG